MLARYFERMRRIIERHGGTVEKFIGDAVVAVFGVPISHEDDAFRALRTAWHMRAALPELGLNARIGVNTGEVVTSGHGTLVTGDAVNVAARLEHAAAPGEIVVGAETVTLAGAAVEVEELDPLVLKGKHAPVAAFRLIDVREVAERRHESRFVGRNNELALLRESWWRALAGDRCELMTVVGEAGVGKSRLASEVVADLGVSVVRGRCLSYGEGITYWPVVEVIKQLDALPDDPAAAATLRSLVGQSDVATAAEEIAWAFRKLLEQSAPLAVVFDDIQWGEETFLDLVEHIALLSTGKPLLLLCLARPEFCDRRPQWPIAFRLDPLPEADVEELLPSTITAELRERIVHAAAGNPLFLTEMLAVAAGAGADVVVPPTLKALLAMRLDQIETTERRVLDRAAVEGEIFHRGAVQALTPTEPDVTTRLLALIRRALIRPEKSDLSGEDCFRFCHLLLRDAAYDALPKATRAELHERFAVWLEDHGADLVERDEILGYHLEQAYRCLVELNAVDEVGHTLARRACGFLVAAARSASRRGDLRAASILLARATDLHTADRLALIPELGEFLFELGEFVRAEGLFEELRKAAQASSDEDGETLAHMWCAVVSQFTGDNSVSIERVIELTDDAVAVLERKGDERALATVLSIAGRQRFFSGRVRAAEALLERARNHAFRAGDPFIERTCVYWLITGKLFGPAPASERAEFLAGLRDELRLAFLRLPLLHIEAALAAAHSGRFEAARAECATAKLKAIELGLLLESGTHAMVRGGVELLAGDPIAAEREFRDGYDLLGELGETSFRSTVGAMLADALLRQSRVDEAEEILDQVGRLALPDDVDAHMRSGAVRAQILAQRGELFDAVKLAREAADLGAGTDFIGLRGDTLVALAEVLGAAGERDEAVIALREALELFELKENVVQAEQARALLAGAVSP